MNGFDIPENYSGITAKKLFRNMGTITEGSSVRVAPCGGDPAEQHTHEHDHLYIVTKGEITIFLCEDSIVLKEEEFFLVKGFIPHSLWNHTYSETALIDISVK